jgi:hypothetical protein
MRRRTAAILCLLVFALTFVPNPVSAQNYSFSVEEYIVDAYWQSDGTLTLQYSIVFNNDASAPPIEFVDIGMHNEYYDLSRVRAWIDDKPISHIAPSEYIDQAFELGLGSASIPPGGTGQVVALIEGIPNVLFNDSEDSEYASARFSPSWFDKSSVHGTTDLYVAYHLPPGIQPEEPRWHASPSGWPSDTPQTGLDSEGRIYYMWRNPSANPSQQYEFGASFPRKYVPADTVAKPSVSQQLGITGEQLIGFLCCGGFFVLIFAIIALAVRTSKKRKLKYLPPKISIEGHGIKRGLTAVEAAVLLETGLDRVLTMILFSSIKKGAARVVSQDPLKIERVTPVPDGLRAYEETFLGIIVKPESRKRQNELQELMIDLVKSVQKKMKGFSLRETKTYYQAIIKKAWQQVEGAETPEVRSQRFDEGLEWTMLDRDFDDRTRRTFRTGPVFVPPWWWLYQPSYPRPTTTTTMPSRGVPSVPGRGLTLPTLPGADFAASMVRGVQNSAAGMVSNLTSFTNGVTKTTNPPPPPSRSKGGWSSGGGGGGSCACACACAGCACACAGGGR